MYTNETIGTQGKPQEPLWQAVLSTLASSTSLDILVLLQENSYPISELAGALKLQKGVTHKYVHRLLERGFIVQGGQRPQTNYHAYYLAKPLVAKVTGLYAEFDFETGLLATGVAYQDGAAHAAATNVVLLPPLTKAQACRLRVTAKNALRFFHSVTHMTAFASGVGMMIGADRKRHKIEKISSTFSSKSARMHVSFTDREPIILERDFSKPAAYAPVSGLGTSYQNKSR